MNQCHAPFEVVFKDLWGLAPFASPSGFRYYMGFVDVHSRFTWFYLLKNNLDTLETFKLFETMIFNHFKSTIKVVQSD